MNKTFTKKSIAAIFLTLLIIFQALPYAAMAETSNGTVNNFTELTAAIAEGKTDITITSDIICNSVIDLAENISITINGDYKLLNPSFSGSGSVTLNVAVSVLDVGGSVILVANKALTSETNGFALKASSSASVTVNAAVTCSNGGIGVEVSGSANVTINGDVKGGDSSSKGGAGAVLSSGKLTIKGNISGGSGDTEGGIGASIDKGIFSVTGNVLGGASSGGNGGIALLYKGVNPNEISASVTGNVTGGAGKNGGTAITCSTSRFALAVSGTVTGGTGSESGGNGIELFYGSQVLTGASVKGGTGSTKNGADFVDKTSTDVFGEFSENTIINLPTYSGSLLKLISGKKSNASLRNLVFNVYEFNIKGKFGSDGTFRVQKLADNGGINWNISANEAVDEYYKFTLTDATVSAIYKNSALVGKSVIILVSVNSTVSQAWSGTLTADGVTLNTLTNDSVYAVVIPKEIVTCKITTSAGPNGKITPLGETMVEAGSSFSFTIAPDTGYQIDKLIVNNIEQTITNSNKYSIPNINTNITISVSFKKSSDVKVTVNVSAGTGGTISPTGEQQVASGSSLTFTIKPSAGYIVDKFTINNTDVAITNNTFTLANITAATTVRVTFKRTDEQFTITVKSGEGGSVTPSGDQKVTYGGSITLKIEPDMGYIINKLYVNNVLVQANNNELTLTNVTSNTTVDVTFVLEDSGEGMIKPEDVDWATSPIRISLTDFTRVSAEVIDTLVDSYASKDVVFHSAKYEIGFSARTLSKIADSYIDFGLIIDNSVNTGKLAEIGSGKFVKVFSFANSVTYLPAEATVKIYLGNQYIGRDVTVYKYESSSGQFVQQFIISVDVGGYASIKTSTPSEFALVTEIVEASFTIEATSGEGGSITPSGNNSYTNGMSATFTFSPDYGYEIDSLKIDNETVELNGNSYTFESINANHTIAVSFKKVENTSITEPAQPKNTAMVVLIVFLVIVLLCAVAFVVLYKMGIIKLKNLKF